MKRRFGSNATVWKLVFDSEGCGCSVDGVPALWAIDQPAPDDLQARCDGVEVWYEKRHEVFFDEPLTITYLPEFRSFKLSSDGQIYTSRLIMQDRRTASAVIGR